jgi:hypothetical protein
MGNPIAVRPCCNVMAVKIVPAPVFGRKWDQVNESCARSRVDLARKIGNDVSCTIA